MNERGADPEARGCGCDQGKADERRQCRLGFWVAAFLLLGLVLAERPVCRGDGWEYFMMVRSLRESGSFRFDAAANASLKADAARHAITDYPIGLHDQILADIDQELGFSCGYLRNADGDYYPYHFFLYAALAVPVEALLEKVGANPFRSLALTNALLMIAVLAYVYFKSRLKPFEKHWLAAAFILCGSTYYLLWPHPEVFTASLLLLTAVAWFDGRPVLAIACAAIAANQNPPAAFLIPVIFLHWHGRLLRDRGWSGIKPDLRFVSVHAAFMVAAGSITLMAPIYYWFKFRHPNPILIMQATDPAYLGWERFHSLWFDLNLGTIMGNAGNYALALLVACFALRWLIRRPQDWGKVVLPALLVVTVVCMSLPAMTQKNWNAGSAVYIRYGYWLMAPLLPVLVLGARAIPCRLRTGLLLTVLAAQAVTVAHNEVFARRSAYMALTPFSQTVMRHFPGLYNPQPDIFQDRTRGADDIVADPARISTFPAGSATVRKILIHESLAPDSARSGKMESLEIQGQVYVPTGPYHVTEVQNGWLYLNGTFKAGVPPGVRVPFNSSMVGWSGWSSAEEAWRWSDSKLATIELPLAYIPGQLEGVVEAAVSPFKEQPVRLLLNGTLIFDGVISQQMILHCTFDPSLVGDDGVATLSFELPGAKQHDELMPHDPRHLALAIEWFTIR